MQSSLSSTTSLATKNLTLMYSSKWHNLIGYTDTDRASQEHPKATSGSTFLIDATTISYSSRKQELLTLSMAEAEYGAAMHAAKEQI